MSFCFAEQQDNRSLCKNLIFVLEAAGFKLPAVVLCQIPIVCFLSLFCCSAWGLETTNRRTIEKNIVDWRFRLQIGCLSESCLLFMLFKWAYTCDSACALVALCKLQTKTASRYCNSLKPDWPLTTSNHWSFFSSQDRKVEFGLKEHSEFLCNFNTDIWRRTKLVRHCWYCRFSLMFQ